MKLGSDSPDIQQYSSVSPSASLNQADQALSHGEAATVYYNYSIFSLRTIAKLLLFSAYEDLVSDTILPLPIRSLQRTVMVYPVVVSIPSFFSMCHHLFPRLSSQV